MHAHLVAVLLLAGALATPAAAVFADAPAASASAIAGAPIAAGTPAARPVVTSGYVTVPGGRIFYESAGQGPAIVLTHDGLLHRETWDAQFEAFAKEYRVIRWDRRGYGRSDPPREPYSHTDDLLAVLREIKVEHAVFIGCSYGGLLTLQFALEHPDMVRGLVLAGPIVTGLPFSDHFKSRGGRGVPPDDAPVDQRIDYYTTIDPWLIAPENTAARAKVRALLMANPQNLKIDWSLVRGPGKTLLSKLPDIRMPALIIVGEADIPDVQAHAGAIEAGLPDARRVVLTHCGHLAHLEAPEAFNKEVLAFLHDLK